MFATVFFASYGTYARPGHSHHRRLLPPGAPRKVSRQVTDFAPNIHTLWSDSLLCLGDLAILPLSTWSSCNGLATATLTASWPARVSDPLFDLLVT